MTPQPGRIWCSFNISFGVDGTSAATPPTCTATYAWAGPIWIWPYPGGSGTDDARKLDDFWHAALDSRGRFLSANNPEELISSLQEVIASIVARRGASTAVSVSLPIITDGTTGYTAGYDTTDWSGFVKRVYARSVDRRDHRRALGCRLHADRRQLSQHHADRLAGARSKLARDLHLDRRPGTGAPFRLPV